MKKVLFVSIFLMTAYGCASELNLELSLDEWIGHGVSGLIEHWGTPSDINNHSNGHVFYSWLFDDGITDSPIDGTINTITVYCKITVDVSKDDIIQSWEIEGNDCKA